MILTVKRKYYTLSIAVIQGLLLLCLHQAIEHKFWPHDQPQWLWSFYTMVLLGPLLLLLSLDEGNIKKALVRVLGFTALAGLSGYYVGQQALPVDKFDVMSLLFAYGVTITIAAFKFLIYLQQYLTGDRFTYSSLFRFSWRNFFTVALSGLFTLSFWGILMLWAVLFKAIKIKFFMTLFTSEWFYYPVLAVAYSCAIIILRQQEKIIDTLTRIQQALMKYLLLILILVAMIFMAALPFTGLEPLWKTNYGSGTLLWMQALILFFLNAVYQDEGHEYPYPLMLHRYIYLGIALLPFYSAIIAYGLFLRIDQYGWTVGRSYGILIWAIFALFSLGYVWNILLKKDHWTDNLSWINIRMGLLLFVVMIAINTPLLDFRKISVMSQMARLDTGAVTYEDFDYRYFKNHLAGPGYRAIEELKAEINDSHPHIIKKIEYVYYRYDNFKLRKTASSRQDFFKELTIWPRGEILADGLKDALYQTYKAGFHFEEPYLFIVDLNGDGDKDYLFISKNRYNSKGHLLTFKEGIWMRHGVNNSYSLNVTDMKNIIETGAVEIIPARWKKIKIGDNTLTIDPQNTKITPSEKP